MDSLEKLKLIRENYSKDLPEKFREIHALFENSKSDGFTEEKFNTLYRLVHNLVGSGATFGFIDVSNSARAITNALEKYRNFNNYPQASDIKSIDLLIEELSKNCMLDNLERAYSDENERLNLIQPSKQSIKEKSKLIYIVDDDKNILDELTIQLRNYGYKIKTFLDTSSFEKAMESNTADIVLMDMIFADEKAGGMHSIIKTKKKSKKKFNVVFMSSNGDFLTRVQAVQAHSDGFVTKPIDIANIIKQLDKLIKKSLEEPIRALLLDDEKSLNEYHESILNSVGIKTKCINNPEEILNVMSDFKPDILITDFYMPKFNGQEVVQVIRQMDEYLSVPILFLSIEEREHVQYRLMDIGSEYFLQKPVDAKVFAQIVKTKALRYRSVREMIQLDGLTNLYNHSTIMSFLEKEILNAKRYNYPLSFAMLDLDYFKKVNDTYGHQAGDSVLQSLSRLLQTRVRKSDLIGRYGGEEFCIIFPHTTIDNAFNVLESIRKKFAQVSHLSNEQKFNVTLSCGICEYKDDIDISTLVNNADKTLYKAKNSGRNIVLKS